MKLFKRNKKAINDIEKKMYSVVMPDGDFNWKEFSEIFGSYKYNDFYKSVWNSYKCIRMNAENVSTLPIQLFQKKAGGDVEVFNNPIMNKLKSKANILNSGIDLLEAFCSYLQIHGDAYLLNIGSKQKPLEMWNLMSQFMDVKAVNENGILIDVSYEYDPGRFKKYTSDEIVHVKYFDPGNHLKGLSPLGVARNLLKTQELADEWNKNLLKNNAKGSLAFIFEKTITDDQRARLKKDLKDNWSGSMNAGKPHIVEGGEGKVDIKQLSFSPQDLDWLSVRKLSIREVGLIFGVPPELLGDNENKTYSNAKEARQGYYTETILPLAEKIFKGIEFFYFWDEKLKDTTHYIRINKEAIEILQVAMGDKVTSLNTAWWLTPNMRLKEMGYSESKNPAMDEHYIPMNLVPIDTIGMPEEDL